MAATAALGVGVALARAERDRRTARARRERERHFGLLPGEQPEVGFRRMALGQLELAIEALVGGDGQPDERAIHETRKALKRLRALVRLLEDVLGQRSAAGEQAALREAGRELAGARDSEVMVSTLDGLLAAHAKQLAHRRSVARLRAQLVAERDGAARPAGGDADGRTRALEGLLAVRERVLGWNLTLGGGIDALEPSLGRIYRRGRRRYRRAAHAKGDASRAMHRWRKRVKELRYTAEMLDRAGPDRRLPGGLSQPDGLARNGQGADARHITELAKRADKLGELLGEDHDLAMLAGRVRTERKRMGRGSRRTLLKLIAKRRKRLRREALGSGRRLYRKRPRAFTAVVRASYARTHATDTRAARLPAPAAAEATGAGPEPSRGPADPVRLSSGR
jgi:CHAD domain